MPADLMAVIERLRQRRFPDCGRPGLSIHENCHSADTCSRCPTDGIGGRSRSSEGPAQASRAASSSAVIEPARSSAAASTSRVGRPPPSAPPPSPATPAGSAAVARPQTAASSAVEKRTLVDHRCQDPGAAAASWLGNHQPDGQPCAAGRPRRQLQYRGRCRRPAARRCLACVGEAVMICDLPVSFPVNTPDKVEGNLRRIGGAVNGLSHRRHLAFVARRHVACGQATGPPPRRPSRRSASAGRPPSQLAAPGPTPPAFQAGCFGGPTTKGGSTSC